MLLKNNKDEKTSWAKKKLMNVIHKLNGHHNEAINYSESSLMVYIPLSFCPPSEFLPATFKVCRDFPTHWFECPFASSD